MSTDIYESGSIIATRYVGPANGQPDRRMLTIASAPYGEVSFTFEWTEAVKLAKAIRKLAKAEKKKARGDA